MYIIDITILGIHYETIGRFTPLSTDMFFRPLALRLHKLDENPVVAVSHCLVVRVEFVRGIHNHAHSAAIRAAADESLSLVLGSCMFSAVDGVGDIHVQHRRVLGGVDVFHEGMGCAIDVNKPLAVIVQSCPHAFRCCFLVTWPQVHTSGQSEPSLAFMVTKLGPSGSLRPYSRRNVAARWMSAGRTRCGAPLGRGSTSAPASLYRSRSGSSGASAIGPRWRPE